MNHPDPVPPPPEGRSSGQPWVNRVYIIDDHPFFATALSSLINNEANLSVCGVGCDAKAVLADLERCQPDVIVTDVHLCSRNNWALAIELRKWSRTAPILFVSSLQNPQAEIGLRWLEPCSFVEKTKDPADIIKAVRQSLAKNRLLQSINPTNPAATKS